ncbi:MAG TPA: peptidylprolyl isomerase [Spirochaetota bacterium]|nr:peptidylprolyl isomerase [Spirochaetota bacterium]HOL57235.1 peptidylprolyl isomerase [Spirochaetota bacterium]HPP05063.1 peptidylprolyl isomerase [Spirochaetota bacterium]
MRRIFLTIFILILGISCSNDEKIIIARFDNGYVTLKEAINEYDNLSDKTKEEIKTKNDYFKHVRKIALEKILLLEALEQGLDKEEKFVKKIEETKKKIAFDLLKKRNVTDKIKIVESDYAKYRKLYSLYQIVKRVDILDKNRIEQSKKILLSLSKEIKDLVSFKEAAKKFSDDVTARNGGFVGEVWSGYMEDEISKVMEKLGTNKVSNLIETDTGLYLIYIERIREANLEELLRDKELYNTIYKEKEDKYETEWYESMLNDFNLKIYKERLKERKYDDEIVIQYFDKKKTRKEFFELVDNYRQNGAFPEPTYEELIQLSKNIALGFIIDNKIHKENLLNSYEFKERFEKEKKFLLTREFIDRNISVPEITYNEIKEFYEKNKKDLFTFQIENGKFYIQPLKEVEDFIKQKLNSEAIQNAKYDLYRKEVEKYHLVIDDKILDLLIKKVSKK